jgi:hypothetical protein
MQKTRRPINLGRNPSSSEASPIVVKTLKEEE